ncbi:unnamed protein product [Cunninghamella blakesleeana]
MNNSITDLSEQLSKWSSHIEQSKDQLKNEVDCWQGYIDEYDALSKQLETFADETIRPAMIPFGKLAFMPGKFLHTNEIMVYLGNQYYVERSTKQAIKIIENRKQGIEENLRLVQAQWNAVKMKSESVDSNLFPSSEGYNEEGLPIMEIREELPTTETSSSSSNHDATTKKINKGKSPASSSFVQYDINKKKLDSSDTVDKKKDQDDLMSILDKLEQEEEEEFQRQQQMIEKQLSLCSLEDDEDDTIRNNTYLNDEDDIDDDLYDTEIADNIFDHFDDDEEYATQGVVDKEDFSSYHEDDDNENKTNTLQYNDDNINENDKIDLIQNIDEKNVINEVTEVSVKDESLISKVDSTATSTSTNIKPNKKISKFKQARLEQMNDVQQQDKIQTSNIDVVSTNNTRRFKPKIPTERRNKTTEKSSSTSTNLIPKVTSCEKDIKEVASHHENESIINEISDIASSSSSPAKKKVSRFKQYQEQQRQKTIEPTDPTAPKFVETTTNINKSKKGNPINVPSRNIPNNNTKINNETIENKSNTKKKVSWGTTTSVREHDVTSAPKESEGIYDQPLKAAIEDVMNNNIDDGSSRITNPVIRSPSDIFKLVKHNQPSFNLDEDGYPILDDDHSKSTSATLSEADIRDLASSVRLSEPIDMWRPVNGIDEDELPILNPFKSSSALSSSSEVTVKKNKKMDTNIMRGAVMERETESLDLDEVEDDMDLREIKSSYQRQRQNILATMGGLSFDPKPEIEVFDDELPLPKDEQSNTKKKDENKDDEIEKPKKVSRFKAARMAMMQPTMED